APFRMLFNSVTAGFATIGAAGAKFAERQLDFFQRIAAAIPDMLCGDNIRARLSEAQSGLQEMSARMLAQVEQDGQDIRDSWDITARQGVRAQEEVADAATAAERAKQEAAEATAAKVEELNQRFTQSAVDAAAAGTRAITDMADAMRLIDSASAVQQLEGLKEALQDAYRSGTISQEEYNAGLNLTNERIQQLGGSAGTTANSIDEVVKSLGDLND